MAQETMEVKIVKIHRLPEGSRVRAFVDLGLNDVFLIKGIRVVNGKEGLFVSMPSEQGKDDRWYERVRCLNKDVKAMITEKILEAYNQE